MIQITYNEMGDMMFLRAEGHAEFAPKGQDIVCAAVSALMQTLAYSLDSGTVTCADDRNLMVVQAKQGTDSLAKFELVTDGLILLADAYPEHVRYINLHADKADAIDLQMFADGGAAGGGGTSQSAGADSSPNGRANASAGAANGEGNAIELPALRPAEERLARRSGVLKRSSREEGSPSPAPPRGEPLAVRKSLSWTRKRQRTRTKPRARTARRRAKARPRARRSGGKPLVSCCAESMPT